MSLRRLFPSAVLLLAASSAGCRQKPTVQPEPAATAQIDRPYSVLIRRAIQTYYPRLLTDGVDGTAAYVWLIADGRGRIVGNALSTVPPRTFRQREAILEKFPDVDIEREAAAVPDAAFATAGTSFHPPPELGPDTVYVFWTDRPFSFRHVPTSRGPFLLGSAASEQIAPAQIRQLAAGASSDDVVWYVYTDEQPMLESGIYPDLHPREVSPDSIVAAVRNMVREKYPNGALSCSLGTSLRNNRGELVITMSVRYEPR